MHSADGFCCYSSVSICTSILSLLFVFRSLCCFRLLFVLASHSYTIPTLYDIRMDREEKIYMRNQRDSRDQLINIGFHSIDTFCSMRYGSPIQHHHQVFMIYTLSIFVYFSISTNFRIKIKERNCTVY